MRVTSRYTEIEGLSLIYLKIRCFFSDFLYDTFLECHDYRCVYAYTAACVSKKTPLCAVNSIPN